MAQDNNRDFYNRVSKVYDAIADASEHKLREQGEQALQLKFGEHVLEIGFGTGNSILNLATMVGAGGTVCGIDISPGMLEVAQRKVARANLPAKVLLQIADARALPYPESHFDAVFMSFTLELFPLDEISEVLAETKRVLKPDGRLSVVSMATVFEGERESLLERSYEWMHRHFPHIVDCRPIDAAGFVEAAGLALQQEKRATIWTMPVSILVASKPAASS